MIFDSKARALINGFSALGELFRGDDEEQPRQRVQRFGRRPIAGRPTGQGDEADCNCTGRRVPGVRTGRRGG